MPTFALYYGNEPDNEKRVVVILNCLSEQHIQTFVQANAEAMASSGHVLDSTVTEIYAN